MKGCSRGDFLGYEEEPAIGLGHKGKMDRLGCEGPRRRASKLGRDATKGGLARKLHAVWQLEWVSVYQDLN